MTADNGGGAILPHGGVLVDRTATGAQLAELKRRAASLPRLELHARELADLELIACGALSPLTGFMGSADYQRVVDEGRLSGGLAWTLPVTLSSSEDESRSFQVGG